MTAANFNPASASFTVNRSDQSLSLANGQTARVGLGRPVFSNGSMNPSALRNFTQRQNSDGSHAACSCNSSVASLAIQGPQAMKRALDNLCSAISPPTQAQQADLQLLDRIRSRVEEGTATTQDLNDLASYLYRTYDSNSTDNQMIYEDVLRMRRDLGLANASTAKTTVIGSNVGSVTFSTSGTTRGQIISCTVDPNSDAFRQSQNATARQLTNSLQNGQSALVGVFNGTTPGRTDKPNHFIEVGRNAQGQLYVYDPLRQPRNYLTGTEAERHLQSHIGVNFGNPSAGPNTEISHFYCGNRDTTHTLDLGRCSAQGALWRWRKLFQPVIG